jgi:hypothetical protein
MSYELLEQSKREFKKDSRRVAIKNFPERTKKEEIDALLSSYHIETTHTDKNNESCKVVFANEVEAARCINEIGLKGSARGWHLEAKYTASDFMICVSHFPLEWNEKEFKKILAKLKNVFSLGARFWSTTRWDMDFWNLLRNPRQ